MNKKKILIPIDGSERSMHSLDFVKQMFDREVTQITIMYVKDILSSNQLITPQEIDIEKELIKDILKAAEEKMVGYDVETYFSFGYPGDEIIKKANEENIGVIVMTKSTKRGLNRLIGSVTSSVVKRAKCVVMIVPSDFSISIN